MSDQTHVTAFTLVSGHLFSTIMYASAPIPTDYRWGAYRFIKRGNVSYHIFQRGGLLSDEAVEDIILAHKAGQARKTGSQ